MELRPSNCWVHGYSVAAVFQLSTTSAASEACSLGLRFSGDFPRGGKIEKIDTKLVKNYRLSMVDPVDTLLMIRQEILKFGGNMVSSGVFLLIQVIEEGIGFGMWTCITNGRTRQGKSTGTRKCKKNHPFFVAESPFSSFDWWHSYIFVGSHPCSFCNKNRWDYIEVSINGGTRQWMVYKGKSHWNGWSGGTSISGNLHVYIYIYTYYIYILFYILYIYIIHMAVQWPRQSVWCFIFLRVLTLLNHRCPCSPQSSGRWTKIYIHTWWWPPTSEFLYKPHSV